MKKFLLSLCFIIGLQSFAMANFYIDAFGDLSYMGDAKTQYGGGFALAMDIIPDLKGVYRFSYTGITKHPLDKPVAYTTWGKKEEYSSIGNRLGVEYVYPVMDRIGWRSSFLIGINSMKYGYYLNDGSTYPWQDDNETGPMFELNTGIEYTVSQHVMPFLEVGYHYTYLSGNLSELSVTGFTVLLGIRVSIFGNTSIGDDY